MPVFAPGQLSELTVAVDGAFFTGGFAVAVRRMQNVVFGLVPTRIEGGPGQRFPGPMMKPANELQRDFDSCTKPSVTFGGQKEPAGKGPFRPPQIW